jgi:hypothetical protein
MMLVEDFQLVKKNFNRVSIKIFYYIFILFYYANSSIRL